MLGYFILILPLVLTIILVVFFIYSSKHISVYPLNSIATTAITSTIDSNIESIEFDGYNYLIIYYKGNSRYILFVWGANKYGAWLSRGLLYLHDPVNNLYEKVLEWDKGMVEYPLMYKFERFISKYPIKVVSIYNFKGLNKIIK